MTPQNRRIAGWFPLCTVLAALPLAWWTASVSAEDRKFVVLMVDFPKDGALPGQLPNRNDVYDGYFDKVKNAERGIGQAGPRIDSFAEWWEEVSYGRVTVSGNVYGWVQLPWPTRPEGFKELTSRLPVIDLNGSEELEPGFGEGFTNASSRFEFDFDGTGEAAFTGNGGSAAIAGLGLVDLAGQPLWGPGERFLDLNGNTKYDAGVREWGIDKNGNGKIDVDPPSGPKKYNAASWGELFGARIKDPTQDDNPDNDEDPITFTAWRNDTEWFDCNLDGRWNADYKGPSMPETNAKKVAMVPFPTTAGSVSFDVWFGDWGGTEPWVDRNGDFKIDSRAEVDEEEGDVPPSALGGGRLNLNLLWRFVANLESTEDESVEYFDQQWNSAYDFPEPYEDFLRRWDAMAHAWVPIEEDYIIGNMPTDTTPLRDRVGNGRYDSPDNWSNQGAVENSNKGQMSLARLEDSVQREEQVLRNVILTIPPTWLEDFWVTTYGTVNPPPTKPGDPPAPPNPAYPPLTNYYAKFDPNEPRPRAIGIDVTAPDRTQINFAPDGGGPLLCLGFPGLQQESGARYGNTDGTVQPNTADGGVGLYDGPAEYDDLPSSIYYSGGDQDFGEVTSPENDSPWGHDIGANSPNIPPIPDAIIPAAGPLAFNVHGDGGYDGGNQLSVEELTWRTDGFYFADRMFDFDGDGTIDFALWHSDTNLDGLLDYGETAGRRGEFGAPPGTPGRPTLHNYCVDTDRTTRTTGATSFYPYNRERALEAAVAALDESVDWDEFLGGPGAFGNRVSGILLLSGRTPGETFEPPASGFGQFIPTRDNMTGLPGILNYSVVEFWGALGASMNDDSRGEGGGQNGTGFDDNGDFKIPWSCHEYGHMWQGWPDLYDYDIIEDDPDNIINNSVGGWCIMAQGGHVHPIPLLKVAAGWLTTVDLTTALVPLGSVSVELRSWEFDSNKTVYVYDNPLVPGESFWFYRSSPGTVVGNKVARQAFNIRQPGWGLNIMHVDDTDGNPESVPNQQRIGSHFTFNYVQADGMQQLENGDNNGDAADIWPGTMNRRKWNRNTDPDSRWYNGQGSGLEIVDIVEKANSSVITFRWTPQELPSLAFSQPPGGVSVNGVYPIKYLAYDQFGGARTEMYAYRNSQSGGLGYSGAVSLGSQTKAPGEIDAVFLAFIGSLPDGTYTFFARLVPGIGQDGKAENYWSRPRGNFNNVGDGTTTVLGVDPAVVRLERWTATCSVDQPPGAEQWVVEGSLSGVQANKAVTGQVFTADVEEGLGGVMGSPVSFRINNNGTKAYKAGDSVSFLTTGLTGHSGAVLIADGEVVDPEPPIAVAAIASGAQSGLAPLTVTFTHADSIDPKGAALTFRWDFGDGAQPVITTDPDLLVEHTYTTPSATPYSALLTVTNSFGLKDTETVLVTVREAASPSVRASANPVAGVRPLKVQFTGDQTTDPNPGTTQIDFVWDFGDGSPVVTSANAQHTYEKAGNYRATLTVTNRPYNKSRSSVIEISVSGPPADQPPIADVTASPRFGNAPLTVVFDAGASQDPEGGVLDFAWNFNDGTPIVRGASVVEHTFTQVRTYNVRLTVTDGSGQTDNATLAIVVTGDASSTNSAPTARIQPSGTQGAAPFTVTFDAGDSFDPENGSLSFSWNFGDGSAATQGEVVTHTFAEPKRYNVVLTVSDDRGASGQATVSISVTLPAGGDSGLDNPGDGSTDGGGNQPVPTMGCGMTGFAPMMLALLGVGGMKRLNRPRRR